MRIQCTVGKVCQYASKPSLPDKPPPVKWVVAIHTHPHLGDIELGNSCLDPAEEADFSEFASKLKAGQQLTLELSTTPTG